MFRVCIPESVKAGQTIRIRCPDGSEGDVKVPKGLTGGQSFIFEMPAVIPSKIEPKHKQGVWDVEIDSLYDFGMALIIGVGIGLSIITGFIIGILAVTDPDDAL